MMSRTTTHRRRALVLGMAAAITLPVAFASVSFAAKPDPLVALLAQDATGPSAQLKAAINQYKAGDFDQAQTALQAIDASKLSPEDQATLKSTLEQVESASNQRRDARAMFEKGQQSLAAGDSAEAAGYYQQVIDNQYADSGTQWKAKEQLALAQANSAPAGNSKQAAEDAYKAGREQFRSGDWINARKNLNKAQNMGFKAGLFEDAPSKYIARMDKKESADRSKAMADMPPMNTAPVMADAKMDDDKMAGGAMDGGGMAAVDTSAPEGSEVGAGQVAPQNPSELPPPSGARETSPPTSVTGTTDDALAGSTPATGPANGGASDNANNGGSTGGAMAADPMPAQLLPDSAGDTEKTRAELEQLAKSTTIQREQKAFQAKALADQARQAQENGNPDSAAALYNEALTLDPANAEIRAAYNNALAAGGVNPVQEPLADRQRRVIEAQRAAIQYSFNSSLEQANAAIASNDYTTARNAVAKAEAARNQNANIFNNNELQSFDQQLGAARTRLVGAEEQAKRNMAADNNAKIAAAEVSRAEAENTRKLENIRTLIDDAQRLTRQGRYGEAVNAVDQILMLDPRNDYAIGVRPLLLDRRNLKTQRDLLERFDENVVEVFNQGTEKTIPYSDVITFSSDWPDLSARRAETVIAERGGSGGDSSATAVLEKELPEIRFQDVAFSDVIDFLRDATQANIFVNWRALEAASIDRSAPVTTRLRNVKFSKVLSTILAAVGDQNTPLSYTVDEGVITISTTEDLARNVETLTYDIRDLIINIPDFSDAPDFNIGQNNNNSGGGGGGGQNGGGGGGGNNSLFGNSNQSNQQEDEGPTRAELVEGIVQLLQETIDQNSWKDYGGQVGSVRELNGQLIVTQTPENHRQIVSLLEKLRETRAIQVMIETRFLTVQRNFLEDIGVDFNFAFNVTDDSLALPGPGGVGVTPVGGLTGINNGYGPINVAQGSAAFTQSNTLQTGLNGNLASQLSSPSLSTTVTAFLDDFQASLLIRATQANQNVTQLTAPRVTLFNGQRAYVLVARQLAYVSDLTPIVGNNAVGFDPTIDTIESGVVLDVAATVSADRKYVTLTLRPQLSRIISITPFPVFGGTVFGNGNGNGGGNNGPVSGTGFIQQPEVEITEVRTSVSVPDKGTLLLGGQTLSGEITREAGVPVLSKVPFLKRLFTNRSTAKDESVLLILVKPTIIIQREVEQQNFPTLNSSRGG